MPTDVRRSARGAPALSPAPIRRVADRMLAELGLADAELSVLLTDDERMRELNLRHRGKDRPTDVLAFPLDERAAREAHLARSGGRDLVLGDVVISLHTADRQARSRRRDLFSETRFLLAHGLLHLIGYDHGSVRQKREMSSLTRRVVRAVADDPKPRATPRSK